MQSRFCVLNIAILVCAVVYSTLSAFGQASQDTWAGTYETQVSLIAGQNTCGDVTVRDNDTKIDHNLETRSISITHVGNTYEGPVDDSGHFTTKPRVVSGGGSEYTISISGHFISAGFEATVTVHVKQPTPPTTCSYEVAWKGKKKSA
jgi:hypothetical protein